MEYICPLYKKTIDNYIYVICFPTIFQIELSLVCTFLKFLRVKITCYRFFSKVFYLVDGQTLTPANIINCSCPFLIVLPLKRPSQIWFSYFINNFKLIRFLFFCYCWVFNNFFNTPFCSFVNKLYNEPSLRSCRSNSP